MRHLPERPRLLAQRACGGVALQTRRLPSPEKGPSYRERNILARPLTLEEVQHFIDTARRIATILTLTDT